MADKFNYEYNGLTDEERKIVESIKDSYNENNTKKDDFLRLKKLNQRVNDIPLINSLTLGIVGLLIFGLGLTFCLEWNNIVLGVILGAIGLIPMGLNPWIFSLFQKHLKNKYKDEILELSNELLK